MFAYFIRRLLLIPFTLIGITLLAFFIMRAAPGGPMEAAMMQAAMGGGGGEKFKSSREQQGSLTPEQLQKLEEQFGYDRPFFTAYAQWLGILPAETQRVRVKFTPGESGAVPTEAEAFLPGADLRVVTIKRDGDSVRLEGKDGADITGWRVRAITPPAQMEKWDASQRNNQRKVEQFTPQAVVYQQAFSGVLQGNLQRSLKYNTKVSTEIWKRVPIATYFGLITLILTYSVCIPLGIVKAMRHRSLLDTSSSAVVFVGYAVPSFVLGSLLLLWASRTGWFPLEGFVSPNHNEMGFWAKIGDLIHHTALPLVCYLVGSFAMLTLLVKNNLMDQLSADYVRTAVAKGLSNRRAIFGHALRNSLIPVATTLGGIVSVFVTGNFLVERIFDIDGLGLFGYNALIERDYFVTMGILLVSAGLLLVGNVLSDLLVAMIDPRVRFS